jgi:hypothetical protein
MWIIIEHDPTDPAGSMRYSALLPAKLLAARAFLPNCSISPT